MTQTQLGTGHTAQRHMNVAVWLAMNQPPTEDEIDEALDETFPASDPIAVTPKPDKPTSPEHTSRDDDAPEKKTSA